MLTEALASESEVRAALIATLRDRIAIAEACVSLDTPPEILERLTLLHYGLIAIHARPLEEVRKLHRLAERVVEHISHGGGGVWETQLVERVVKGGRAGMPTLDQGAGQTSFEQPVQIRPATNLSEPTHCFGSSYHCQPDEWGCDCECGQCDAARAV